VIEDQIKHDCQRKSRDEENNPPVGQEKTEESYDNLTQSPANG